MRLLCDAGASARATGPQVFFRIAKGEVDADLAAPLADRNCDPNASFDGTTALLEAVRAKQIDAVKALLEAQADVNRHVTCSPLHAAETPELVAKLDLTPS